MSSQEKKIAAALSGVTAYLQLEQEALAGSGVPAAPKPAAAHAANVWGTAGRSAMMQMRAMMQLKAFNRLR